MLLQAACKDFLLNQKVDKYVVTNVMRKLTALYIAAIREIPHHVRNDGSKFSQQL